MRVPLMKSVCDNRALKLKVAIFVCDDVSEFLRHRGRDYRGAWEPAGAWSIGSADERDVDRFDDMGRDSVPDVGWLR